MNKKILFVFLLGSLPSKNSMRYLRIAEPSLMKQVERGEGTCSFASICLL